MSNYQEMQMQNPGGYKWVCSYPKVNAEILVISTYNVAKPKI